MLHPLGISDIDRAAAFYDAVLVPLGYVRVWEDLSPGDDDQAVGYGVAGGDKLAIKQRSNGQRPPGPGFHSPSPPPTGRRSRRFTRRRSRMAAKTMVAPACGRITARITLPRLWLIRMGTTSRRCSTRQRSEQAPPTAPTFAECALQSPRAGDLTCTAC